MDGDPRATLPEHMPSARCLRRAVTVLALVLAAVSACGGHQQPAATVNGTPVSATSLRAELGYLQHNRAALAQLAQSTTVFGSGADGFAPAFVAQVLDGQIQQVVLAAEIRRRGLTAPVAAAHIINAQQVSGYSAYPPAYQNELATRVADRIALAAALSDTPLTTPALQAYLTANTGEFTRYCLSGLALGTQSAATDAAAALRAGARLHSIAVTESIDPNTQHDGGILGCGDGGDFPGFTSQLNTLALGAYSSPIRVGQSWWVITLTTRATQSLAAATPAILTGLVTSYGPFNTWLQQALAGATVSVDSSDGRWDPHAVPPAVVAP